MKFKREMFQKQEEQRRVMNQTMSCIKDFETTLQERTSPKEKISSMTQVFKDPSLVNEHSNSIIKSYREVIANRRLDKDPSMTWKEIIQNDKTITELRQKLHQERSIVLNLHEQSMMEQSQIETKYSQAEMFSFDGEN